MHVSVDNNVIETFKLWKHCNICEHRMVRSEAFHKTTGEI